MAGLHERAILTSISMALFALAVAAICTRSSTPLPFQVAREVLAGGLAAFIGEALFYPMEVAKGRLQAARKGGGKPASLVGELLPLLRQGASGYFTAPGVVAGVSRALIYHGLRLGLFPPIKRALAALFSGSASIVASVIAAATCGAIGAALCNPFDLVKARMAALPTDYPNSLSALAVIAQREGGAASLWRGAPATTLRAALGSGAQLVTYSSTKRLVAASPMLPSGYGLPVLLATCASAAAYVTAAAPADLVKTRLMLSRKQQAGAGRGADAELVQYTGAIDCLRRSIRDEGPLVLFKGWGASFARLLPVLLIVFPLLERLRVAFGVGTF